MDEVAGLDRLEPVPDTAWHEVRVAGPKENVRLDARRPLVTVVKDQFHRAAHDVQELVTVGMDLQVKFQPHSEEFTIPVFVPAAA